MSLDDGKIELRLRDMNFNMLSGPDARDGSRSNGGGDDRGRRRFTRKREDGLGFGGSFFVAARSVDFQAPLGLVGRRYGNRGKGLGSGEVSFTKRAHFHVLVRYRATLRADLNHSVRFALRTEDWRTRAS